MARNLPQADWVIGGDFNMVEFQNDHSWPNHSKLSIEEFDKWLLCHNSIGVIDPIHDKSSTHDNNWFTWSNCRFGDERKLSKLDRFYISPSLHIAQDVAGLSVRVDYTRTLSDHFPIICSVSCTPMDSEISKLPYKLNISHLKNPSCVAALIGLWKSIPKANEGVSQRDWRNHAIFKVF